MIINKITLYSTNTIKNRNLNFTSVDSDGKLKKENFYNQINKYLNKEIDKTTYLTDFQKEIETVKKSGNGKYFSSIERKYINDLLMTLDLTDKLEKFSETYLKQSMQKLLANKK